MKLLCKPLALLLFFVAVNAQALPSWQWINPLPQADVINALLHSDDKYVAVGNAGTVLTSSDALIWSTQPNDIKDDLLSVVWSLERREYIMVGKKGGVYGSLDGLSWVRTTNDTGFALNKVIWNVTLQEYLAVGNGGVISVSSDGVNWTFRDSGTGVNLLSVAWDDVNARYLAVGQNATILSSKKGIVWLAEDQGIKVIATAIFTDIIVDSINNQYVVTGVNGGNTGLIITSPSNVDDVRYQKWLFRTVATGVLLSSVSINPNNGLLVAVGDNGIILTSSGGKNWSFRNSNVKEPLYASIWDDANQQFLVAGANSRILKSSNGGQWRVSSSGVTYNLSKLTYDVAHDRYLAVGASGTVLTSQDSIAWFIRDSGITNDLNSLAFNSTSISAQMLAVGNGGAIISSNNGSAWVLENSGTTEDLFFVYWDDSHQQYVAGGGAGTLMFSVDGGNSWTMNNTGIANTSVLRAVVWSDVTQQYIAVGQGGDVFSGTYDINGALSWNAQNSSVNTDLLAVTWGGTAVPQYLAVGQSGRVLSSVDGINWLSQSSGVVVDLRSVIWDADGQVFMAAGNGGVILSRADGVNWTRQSNPDLSNIAAIIWDGSRKQYLTAGDIGTLLRRDIESPIMTLLGLDTLTVAQGTGAFNDPGVKVVDNIDSTLQAKSDINANIAVVGQYILNYNVTDQSGNKALTVTRTVNVTDQTPPVITLLGSSRTPFFAAVNVPFNDLGVSITDNVDAKKDIIQNVQGTVDTSTLGLYRLTYDATDSAGNIANTVIRIIEVVEDTSPPVINIIGNASTFILVGDVYTDLGAGAFDAVDGDISRKVVVDNPVDRLVIGSYPVTYSVTDASGNTATAVRAVEVKTLTRGGGSLGGWSLWVLLMCYLMTINTPMFYYRKFLSRQI